MAARAAAAAVAADNLNSRNKPRTPSAALISRSSLPIHSDSRPLQAGASHLLLDNFEPATAAELVRIIDGRAKVEISGGVTLQRMRELAATGADFVSVGALTHSAPAVDLSFDIEPA